MKILKLLLVTIMAFLIVPLIAQAMPMYQSQVMPLQTCQACHENVGGGSDLNRFGKDFDNAGHIFKKIAKLDSDKDGFTNAQEIAARTLPGDPDSNPNSSSPFLYVVLTIVVIVVIVAVLVFLKSKKKSGQRNG